jgi:hypothetical protein
VCVAIESETRVASHAFPFVDEAKAKKTDAFSSLFTVYIHDG